MRQFVSLALVLAAAALTALASAQPYAASGGFDRARKVAAAAGLPSGAVAADQGTVYIYWDDSSGIVRLPLSAEEQTQPETVLTSRNVRRILATTVDDSAALVWVMRDPATGSWGHALTWRGETRLLLDDLRQSPVAVAPGPAGPAVAIARFSGTDMVLELHYWDGPVRDVHLSDKEIDGLSLVFDDQGAAHLSWLEGEVRRTELGNISEWQAFYARVAVDGSVSAPVLLGEAGRRGVQFVTRVDLAAGRPTVMWTTQAGELLLANPGDPARSLGRGHPIGVFGGYLYWFENDAIRRQALTGGDVDSVVWSPTTPERVSVQEWNGALYLGWYGGKVGGGYAVFAADNRTPISLTLQDRIAGRMGWSPWTFWESLAGQSLTSLLVALLATLVLSPVMLIASLLLARVATSERSTLVGIGIGVATLAVVVVGALLLPLASSLASPRELFGPPWEIVLAFALAGGLTWLARRRADDELVFDMVASAGLTSLVTLFILGFVNFQTWSGLWEGVL